MYVLHGIVAGKKDAEEDHGDVGLTISSNGQEYPLQSVFSSQRTEARGVRVNDVRSSVTGMDLGKARRPVDGFCVFVHNFAKIGQTIVELDKNIFSNMAAVRHIGL